MAISHLLFVTNILLLKCAWLSAHDINDASVSSDYYPCRLESAEISTYANHYLPRHGGGLVPRPVLNGVGIKPTPWNRYFVNSYVFRLALTPPQDNISLSGQYIFKFFSSPPNGAAGLFGRCFHGAKLGSFSSIMDNWPDIGEVLVGERDVEDSSKMLLLHSFPLKKALLDSSTWQGASLSSPDREVVAGVTIPAMSSPRDIFIILRLFGCTREFPVGTIDLDVKAAKLDPSNPNSIIGWTPVAASSYPSPFSEVDISPYLDSLNARMPLPIVTFAPLAQDIVFLIPIPREAVKSFIQKGDVFVFDFQARTHLDAFTSSFASSMFRPLLGKTTSFACWTFDSELKSILFSAELSNSLRITATVTTSYPRQEWSGDPENESSLVPFNVLRLSCGFSLTFDSPDITRTTRGFYLQTFKLDSPKVLKTQANLGVVAYDPVTLEAVESVIERPWVLQPTYDDLFQNNPVPQLKPALLEFSSTTAGILRIRTKFPLEALLPTIHSSEPLAFALSLSREIFKDISDDSFSTLSLSEAFITQFTVIPEKYIGDQWLNARDIVRFDAKSNEGVNIKGIPLVHSYSRVTQYPTSLGPAQVLELLVGLGKGSNWMQELRRSLQSQGLQLPTHIAALQQVVSVDIDFFLNASLDTITALQQYLRSSSLITMAREDSISVTHAVDHIPRTWVSTSVPVPTIPTQSIRHDDGIISDFSVKQYSSGFPISGFHLTSDFDRSAVSLLTYYPTYYLLWDEHVNLTPTPQLPVESVFEMDYRHENIITSFSISVPQFPVFEDALPNSPHDGIHVFFNDKSIDAVPGNTAANGLSITSHNIKCLTIPKDSYISGSSILVNWEKASANSSKPPITTTYRREKPSLTMVSNVQAYKDAFDVKYPTSPQEGLGLIVDEEVDLHVFHISPLSYANTGSNGLVILCVSADVKGPIRAETIPTNLSSYSVPIFFTRSLDSNLSGHGFFTTPVISPGLPRSEDERDTEGNLRMRVSLHLALRNTRYYDTNIDQPKGGVLFQDLTSLPMATPLALQIHIPHVGISYSPPSISDLTQRGRWLPLFTQVTLKSRLLKPMDTVSPQVKLSFSGFTPVLTPVITTQTNPDGSSTILFTISIYFGTSVAFTPQSSFTLIMENLMFRRDRPALSSEPTFILEQVKFHFSEDIHVNHFVTRIPTIPQPLSLPLSALSLLSTSVKIRGPPSAPAKVQGSVVPLVYTAAMPAAFSNRYPNPLECEMRVLLRLPLPTGAVYPFSKIPFYQHVTSNEKEKEENPKALSPVVCQILRLNVDINGNGPIHPIFTFIADILDSGINSKQQSENDIYVILPNFKNFSFYEEQNISYAITCTVYTYLTTDYDQMQKLPRMSFMGKTNCEKYSTSTEYAPILILGEGNDPLFTLPTISLPTVRATTGISPALVSIPAQFSIQLDHFPGFILPHDTFELEFPVSHQPLSTPEDNPLFCSLSRLSIGPYSGMTVTESHPISGFTKQTSLPETSMLAQGRISTTLTNPTKKTLMVTILPPTDTTDSSMSAVHLATLSKPSFDLVNPQAVPPPLILTCDNVIFPTISPAYNPPSTPSSSVFILRSRKSSEPPGEYDVLREGNQPLFELSAAISFPAITRNQFVNPQIWFTRMWTEEPMLPGRPTPQELGNVTFIFDKLNIPSYVEPSGTSAILFFQLNMPAGFRTISYSSPLFSPSLCEGIFTVLTPLGYSLQTFPLHLTLSSANPSAPIATHNLLLEVPSSARGIFEYLDPNNHSLGVLVSSGEITCKGFASPLSGPVTEPLVVSMYVQPPPIGGAVVQSELFMRSVPPHVVTIGTRAAVSATISFLPPVAGALSTLTYIMTPARVRGKKFEILLELPAGTNCESNGDINEDLLEIPVTVTITLLVTASGDEIVLNSRILPIFLIDQATFAFERENTKDSSVGPFVVPMLGIRIPFEIPSRIDGNAFTLSSTDGIRVQIAKVRTPPVASEKKERGIRAQIIEVSSLAPASLPFFAARKTFMLAGLEDGQGRMALQRVMVDPYRGRFAAFASPFDGDREGFPTTGGLFVFSIPSVVPFVNPELVTCTIAHHTGDSYLAEPSTNAFPVTSVSIGVFSSNGENDNGRDDTWAAQGNRSRIAITINPQTAKDLAFTPYQFGVVVQCIGATPIALELRSEATYYIEIFKLDPNTTEDSPSYTSISSTATAILGSVRAPNLTPTSVFSQSSAFAGDIGSMELYLERLAVNIQQDDVIEIAFPHNAYYRFGETVQCSMTRVIRDLVTDNNESEEQIGADIVRTSFSSTSLFRATTAVLNENGGNESENSLNAQPHIVSFRFSFEKDEKNPKNTVPIFNEGDGFKWACTNVVFPSNVRNTQSYLEVSVYHSLTETVSPYTDPLDTLLVRTAFNDDVSLPSIAPQRPHSVTFHSALPYLGAHTRIGVEIVLVDSIILNSQERRIVLALEMPLEWKPSLSASCVMSIGSPYLEDANITGEVITTISEVEQKSSIITFSFFPPEGVLRHVRPLYLFCTDVQMPTAAFTGDGDDSDNSDSGILKYQTLPTSTILALDDNLVNILAQSTSSRSPIIQTTTYPEMISVISLTHSFVSFRPFLESEIEEWKSTIAQVYALRLYSIYSEVNDTFLPHTILPFSLAITLSSSLAPNRLDSLGVGSNGAVGIQSLIQRRIPLIAQESTKDKHTTPLTVFGSRNYIPNFHYEVNVTAEIRSPQPWLTVDKIYENMSNPQTVVAANATFSQRYNLSTFTSTLSLGTLSSSCADGVVNEEETDIDCGGSICAKCHVGKGCVFGSDCVSGVCGSAGVCLDAYSAAQGVFHTVFPWILVLYIFALVM